MIPLLPKRLRGAGPGALIREGWQKLASWPGGARLFHHLLGRAIPYTGALGAEIVALERGRARVRLDQRRAIENHLGSIHAIALANLAELTGNLALAYSMPDDARFIVTSLAIDYLKKARGRIEAVCECEPPRSSQREEYTLQVHISDAGGTLVATARIQTLVSPVA